jgi:pantetheine-phosphate adenylyltransferase
VSVALYAGSFDPIHLGHVSVIERAAHTHDEVVVAVVSNPNKPSGMFRTEERLALVIEATSHLPTVRCAHFYGLTVDLARQEGATVLVRSAHKELHDEISMAAMNRAFGGIQTVFVSAEPSTRAISSTVVRQLVSVGHLTAAQEMVPGCVATALAKATTPRLIEPAL